MSKVDILNLSIAGYGAILATFLAIYSLFLSKRKKITVKVESDVFTRMDIDSLKSDIENLDVEKKEIVLTTITNLKEHTEKVSSPSIKSISAGSKIIPLQLVLHIAPVTEINQQFYQLESGESKQFSFPSELLLKNVVDVLENVDHNSNYVISDKIHLKVAPNKTLISKNKLLFNLESMTITVVE